MAVIVYAFLYLYRRVGRVGHNDVVVDVTAERWDMGQRYDLDKIAASHITFHVKKRHRMIFREVE
jgi:hypothetical protein